MRLRSLAQVSQPSQGRSLFIRARSLAELAARPSASCPQSPHAELETRYAQYTRSAFGWDHARQAHRHASRDPRVSPPELAELAQLLSRPTPYILGPDIQASWESMANNARGDKEIGIERQRDRENNRDSSQRDRERKRGFSKRRFR